MYCKENNGRSDEHFIPEVSSIIDTNDAIVYLSTYSFFRHSVIYSDINPNKTNNTVTLRHTTELLCALSVICFDKFISVFLRLTSMFVFL